VALIPKGHKEHSVTLSVRIDPVADFYESLASRDDSTYALVPFQLMLRTRATPVPTKERALGIAHLRNSCLRAGRSNPGGVVTAIVGIVFPIFALIGLGYLGRRLGLLSGDAAAALSGYVYYFSLPALLYVKVAEVPVAEFFSGNLIFAYSGGILTASLLIWAVGRLRRMDRRTIGMFILNATFGNVGYMGVPFPSRSQSCSRRCRSRRRILSLPSSSALPWR